LFSSGKYEYNAVPDRVIGALCSWIESLSGGNLLTMVSNHRSLPGRIGEEKPRRFDASFPLHVA